jgi:DNA repair ATPase RecN
MIRTDAEYKNAQEKLDQEQETLQWQREQLEEMDLSDEEARWRKMVIRILPNMGSAWRLIRAVLAEEH